MARYAIAQGRAWHMTGDDTPDGLVVESFDNTQRREIDFADPTLIIEPTDDELADYCAECGVSLIKHPRHKHKR